MTTLIVLFAAALAVEKPASKGEYPDYGRVEVGDFAEIGPEEYRPLRRELRTFYPRECHEQPKSPAVLDSFARCWQEAQAWSAAHPNHSALEMRRASYAIEQKNFQPILFAESPFYFEAGINGGYFRGNSAMPSPGRCARKLCDRFYRERNLVPDAAFKRYSARCRHHFAVACGTFVDEVHDLPPFHAVFTKGFGGIRAEVVQALAACPADDAKGRAELEAMLDGLDTIHCLQLKFAEAARKDFPIPPSNLQPPTFNLQPSTFNLSNASPRVRRAVRGNLRAISTRDSTRSGSCARSWPTWTDSAATRSGVPMPGSSTSTAATSPRDASPRRRRAISSHGS